jgi:hypothetical protein
MTGLDQLLDRMMPGDATRGLPSFGTLNIDLETHFSADEFSAIENIMSHSGEEKDVNLLLKSLRADLPALAQTLTNRALDLYFTHPVVTAALQQGRTTLFPHERSPEALDYDLLAEVYAQQRGSLL